MIVLTKYFSPLVNSRNPVNNPGNSGALRATGREELANDYLFSHVSSARIVPGAEPFLGPWRCRSQKTAETTETTTL
jgi:hypothetical protein